MFGNKKKCIVCKNVVSERELVKKYNSFFCGEKCLEKYEILLADAKKKKLDNCC